MKLPAYPRTKPSGVAWLGDVPEHWEVKPLKHLTDFINGSAFKPEEWSQEGTPIIRIENLNGGEDFNYYEGEVRKRYHVKAGDLLFGWSGNRGTSFGPFRWSRQGHFFLNQHIFRLAGYSCHDSWFYWTLRAVTKTIEDEAHGIIGMVHVTKGKLGAVKIPSLPFTEQTAIAAFLDRETGRVDRLVAKKRELIERLKEKRTALISRTVTRGLPPAATRAAGLPANPPLKPSGTSWLGDIPEHWEVKKFGYISIVVRGASPRPAGDARYFDGDFIPWITVGEVTKDEKVFLSGTETMLTEEGAANSRTIRSGTLVLTNSGATLGVPKILAVTGCANDGVVAFEGLSKDANKFFLYYFLRSLTENLRDRIKQGSGQPNLNTEIVKALCVPFPPLPEQAAIAAYLDEETAKLDALVAKVEEAVKRLQEYRTALITAAVTGKIDLRNHE